MPMPVDDAKNKIIREYIDTIANTLKKALDAGLPKKAGWWGGRKQSKRSKKGKK